METIHPQILWVVGQRVSVVSVTKNYSLADTLAPPAVPGPPLHVHENCCEQFYVLEGELEIITETGRRRLGVGESLIVPPNTPHTFENATEADARAVSVYSPPGFEQ